MTLINIYMNEEIEIDIDLTDDDLEPQWKRLITEILNGNVIPVIGPDFLIADSKNLHEQIVAFLAKKFHVESQPHTFSQLIYDSSFKVKRNKIYNFIDQVINVLYPKEHTSESKTFKRPNELLEKLLSTKRFPFVITTSFTPVVERVMKDIWGKEPRVLIFKNDPSNDKYAGKGDIVSAKDLEEPTVYYMLGKHCKCDLHPDFVVTDLDMMQFCQRWVSGVSTPPILTNVIKDKYLLVLGNNYSDWLLRFIWYSLRSDDKLKYSLFVEVGKEEALIKFLNRLEVFTQTDPKVVVEEICRRLDIQEKQTLEDIQIQQKYTKDVFLSYSRRDSAVALRLMKELSEQGVSVWLDNEGGISDAEKWEAAISRGIKECRIFIPLLTANIEKEFVEEHEYRIEWKKAEIRSLKMGERPFIFPLAEKGFDFYNELTGLPETFKEKNAVWYDTTTDMSSISDRIRKKIETIKELEKLCRINK